jgi:GxxExxY protein
MEIKIYLHFFAFFASWRLCVKIVHNSRKGGAMNENEISKLIVDAAMEVHRTLGGPGLLESVYECALEWEIRSKHVSVERQRKIPIWYKGFLLPIPLRLDLVVENLVIVECKATMDNHQVFESQLLTYLRVTGLRLGMLVNFGFPIVKRGISRVVNHLPDDL